MEEAAVLLRRAECHREQAYTVLHSHFPGRLQIQEPLAHHCSFEVGGPADLWLTLQTPQELKALIRTCTTHQWPLLLVGKGRNILFADAGVCWSQLLPQLQVLGWAGLEFGIGIPDDMFVPVVEGRYVREDLDLGYRHSRFRIHRAVHIDADGKLVFPSRQLIEPAEIVLRLALRLQRKDPHQIAALSHQYMQERQTQEPALPKTGPVFKDPAGSLAKDLIAQAGLGGKTIGNAKITEQNANYIANLGGATAQEILLLILMVYQHVLAQFGIALLLNLEILGEWPVEQMDSTR